jgi:lipopolysaccharide transport system ATP-binding protein
MSDIVIKAENLGKKYTIGHKAESGRYTALRDVLMQNARGLWHKTKDLVRGKPIIQGDRMEEVWALKDVSFEIHRGEAVGIIGRNGAGKSTLLKVLSRITEPSAGRVTIKGRVASLLEVGTGFHPELTGRENIYLNGAILGMARQEIKRKFDEIVAFAEIERFLDTPVKRYSSGMYVRLAFAVAAHLEPEILLVDEVLAVGDAAFQKKCLGRMGEVVKEGRTVLFVSHNMAAIQALCEKAIWLESGMIACQGGVEDQIKQYLNLHSKKTDIRFLKPKYLNNNLYLQRFEITPNPVLSGAPANFLLEFRASAPARIGELSMLIYSSLGMRVAVLDLRRSDITYELDGSNPLIIRGAVQSLPLVEGEYQIGLYIGCGETLSNFLDLFDLTVYYQPTQGVAPYSPNVRGVLNLNVSYQE